MAQRFSTISSTVRTLRSHARGAARHWATRLHRAMLPRVRFIAVTGSAGKTTTKSLAATILSSRAPCMSSSGTGNEHYDVEHTILATTRRHACCIVEVSAGRPGYIDRSIRALRPEIGVLTMIAREHFSAFGSSEAIAAEKGKLIAALPAHGTAVLNIDDPLVRSIGERFGGRIIWVGTDEGATLRLLEANSCWPDPLTLRVLFEQRTYEIRTRLHGNHQALAVLCALGIALAAGLSIDEAIAALTLAEPMQARMQIERTEDGVAFVRDDWKAPQWSFGAPLEFMRAARAKRKVAVIGTISDSPKSPSQRYAFAARQALEVAEMVVLVGVDARAALKTGAGDGRSLHAFARIDDAARFLKDELRAGDLVLLKGTNKQDHLVRLVLDRDRPVRCWRTDCGRAEFCAACELLDVPSGLHGDAAAVASPGSSPLIVGLGNPQARYEGTPHNVGYLVVDRLARAAGGRWEAQPEGLVSTASLDGIVITLLKPAAAMNLSGAPVQRFLARTGRSAAECIVVHDDMDFELGVARAKRNGGDGGHKGVRSIIAALGTDEVARVRVGVRRPGDSRKAMDLVLAGFSSADQAVLAPGLERADAALRDLLRELSRPREPALPSGQ